MHNTFLLVIWACPIIITRNNMVEQIIVEYQWKPVVSCIQHKTSPIYKVGLEVATYVSIADTMPNASLPNAWKEDIKIVISIILIKLFKAWLLMLRIPYHPLPVETAAVEEKQRIGWPYVLVVTGSWWNKPELLIPGFNLFAFISYFKLVLSYLVFWKLSSFSLFLWTNDIFHNTTLNIKE